MARALRTADGLGMLLHQAVRGFALWFGTTPAVTPELRALVEADLAPRHESGRDNAVVVCGGLIHLRYTIALPISVRRMNYDKNVRNNGRGRLCACLRSLDGGSASARARARRNR